MKFKSLLITLLASSFCSAATVNFTSGTFGVRGEGGLTLFETSSNTSLSGGTLLAGIFTAPPVQGSITQQFLNDNFQTFSELGTGISSAAGFFADGTFDRSGQFSSPANSSFENANLYLLILDNNTITGANNFALLRDSSWTFGNDTSSSTVNLGNARNSDIIAGVFGESTPGTPPGDFDSIQLVTLPVPEPSTALLGLLGLGFLARRKR